MLREFKAKLRMQQRKADKRLELTKGTKFWPRLEKLSEIRGLDQFERSVLIALVGNVISDEFTEISVDRYSRGNHGGGLTVGYLLGFLCSSLQEQVDKRAYFYKNSHLVKDGMIRLGEKFSGDLMKSAINIDRRMLDYIVGLDTEFDEVVNGSFLYLPKVKLENVKLPTELKQLIVDSVAN